MRFCPQCGKESTADVKYCDFCGYAFSDDEQQTAASSDGATPFAVGAETTSSRVGYELGVRDVPKDVFGAVKLCFRHGGVKGRASRPEFWYWALFLFLTVFLPCVSIMAFVSASRFYGGGMTDVVAFLVSAVATIVVFIWGLVCLGPTFTVAVRRLHDLNCPGTPLYVALAFAIAFPFVGGFLLNVPHENEELYLILTLVFLGVPALIFLGVLVVAAFPGSKGANKYGPQPEKREIDPSNWGLVDASRQREK